MTSGANSAAVRSQLLIDKAVQTPILQRIIFYTLACAIYFIIIIFSVESSFHEDEPFFDTAMRCVDVALFWAPGLMLLFPVVIYDLLTLTNRFAGPMFRLRREMQRLARGESEYPLGFRDNDYWIDVADDFNLIRDELMDLRMQVASGQHARDESRQIEESGEVETTAAAN